MDTETTPKKRQAMRDSLFLSADVTVKGARKSVTVRVRNLSPGGMMIDGNPIFHEGAEVIAEMRGIGLISGKIAWLVDERAGISFDEEIDPKVARSPVTTSKPKVLFAPTVDKTRRPGLKLR